MFTTPDSPEAVQAAVEATLRNSEEHHRSSALPRLGLPATWKGQRQTGASSVHRSFSGLAEDVDRSTATPSQRWETVELIHGSYPDGPWLAVAISDAPAEELGSSVVAVLGEEIEAVMPDEVVPAPEDGYPVTRVTVEVRIDGAPVVLQGASYFGLTVARAVWEGVTLTVKSRDWPHDKPVELARLDDVEAYLNGWRESVLRSMDI